MSLVFGGPAPAMMSPLMRKFVLSTEPVPTIDDIKDPIFYGQIKEVIFLLHMLLLLKYETWVNYNT